MTPRLTPLSGDDLPKDSRSLLSSVERALGTVPNLRRTLVHSPAALKSYVASAQALSMDVVSPVLREQLAVGVTGNNRCEYCDSAYTMLGRSVNVTEDKLTCRVCALEHGPTPLLQLAPGARILIADQAPGRRVDASGHPFDDASGQRPLDWLGFDRDTLLDPRLVAIFRVASGDPGKARSGGDPPPLFECASTWRRPRLDRSRETLR